MFKGCELVFDSSDVPEQAILADQQQHHQGGREVRRACRCTLPLPARGPMHAMTMCAGPVHTSAVPVRGSGGGGGGTFRGLPLSRVPLNPTLCTLPHSAGTGQGSGSRGSHDVTPCLHDLTTWTLAAQVVVDLTALGDEVKAAVAACSDPDAVICPSLPQLVALLGEGSAQSPGSAEARQLVAEAAGVRQLVF